MMPKITLKGVTRRRLVKRENSNTFVHEDDNGRKRFFERCLDHQPMPPRRTVLMNCQEAKSAGITWRRVNQQARRDWSHLVLVPKLMNFSILQEFSEFSEESR